MRIKKLRNEERNDAFVAGPRNEAPHGRDMSARPNTKALAYPEGS